MAKNKVRFNLYNVHYAILTPDDNGAPTYGTPKAVPGAVTIELEENGSMEPFYADGIIYYMSNVNNGYTGSLEMALFPDDMYVDIWGAELDSTTKVLTESANVEPKEIALQFQIDGNATPECYTLYRVMLGRPGFGSATNTDTKTPQTQTADITAAPIISGAMAGRILSKTTGDTPEATRTGWFTKIV